MTELNTDFTDNYIDSIINNYKNLGNKPFLSILSAHKDNNQMIFHIMHGSIMNECYKNNVIKHIDNCSCLLINYEKFSVNNNLEFTYYNKSRIIPYYINDIACILQEIIRKFYLP